MTITELRKKIKELEQKREALRKDWLYYKRVDDKLRMLNVEKVGKDVKLDLEIKKRMLIARQIGLGKNRDQMRIVADKEEDKPELKEAGKVITAPFRHD